MYNFYKETEPKLFCLLILVSLYVFHKRITKFQSRENKLLYYFSFAEVLFLILSDYAIYPAMQNICMSACIFCGFFSVFFCFDYALQIIGAEMSALKRVMSICIGVVFEFLYFCSLYYKINVACFALVFAVIALFIWDQYNKIRVDNLTKLYNRYGMDAELKEQLRQYENDHNDSFCIISCDLDNFKHINDTWGHLEGDRALVLVAGALSKVGKKFSSGVFRIGGDEFVIITDISEEALVVDVTNAIKSELDNLEFRDDFDIKMSIGVALYDGVTSIDDILNNADKKMYEVKRKSKK